MNQSQVALRASRSEEFDIAAIRHLDVTGRIKSKGCISMGGYSDVYRGTLRSNEGKIQVAIKELRVRSQESKIPREERLRKRFYREIVVWNQLRHPNIVPLLGFTMAPNSSPTLISPLYPNGNIVKYLQCNPSANRPQLLLDVGYAVHYLHSLQLVHGDIKGDNILVNDHGSASLCDFGMSKFIEDALHINGYTTSGTAGGGTPRWLCPEILNDDPRTKMTDIWAFASAAIQILTDQVPYANITNNNAVPAAIITGQPPLPKTYAPSTSEEVALWRELRKCWDMVPDSRPDIGAILYHIQTIFRLENTIGDTSGDWLLVESDFDYAPPSPRPASIGEDYHHPFSLHGSSRVRQLKKRLSKLWILQPGNSTDADWDFPADNPPGHDMLSRNDAELKDTNEIDCSSSISCHGATATKSKEIIDSASEENFARSNRNLIRFSGTVLEPNAAGVSKKSSETAQIPSEPARNSIFKMITANTLSGSRKTSKFNIENTTVSSSSPIPTAMQKAKPLVNKDPELNCQSPRWSIRAPEELPYPPSVSEIERQDVIRELVESEERYFSRLVRLKKDFIIPLLHPFTELDPPDDPLGDRVMGTTEHFRRRISNGPDSISRREDTWSAMPKALSKTELKATTPPDLPTDLRRCLDILDQGIFEAHERLIRNLRQEYDANYSPTTNLIMLFIAHVEVLKRYATYMEHLEQAQIQVDEALTTKWQTKLETLGVTEASRWVDTVNYWRKLEHNATKCGERGLAASLALPFKRICEYCVTFRTLLLHSTRSNCESDAIEAIVDEMENVLKATERPKVQKGSTNIPMPQEATPRVIARSSGVAPDIRSCRAQVSGFSTCLRSSAAPLLRASHSRSPKKSGDRLPAASSHAETSQNLGDDPEESNSHRMTIFVPLMMSSFAIARSTKTYSRDGCDH